MQLHGVATQGPGAVYLNFFVCQRKVLVVKAAICINAELYLRRIGIRNTVGADEIAGVVWGEGGCQQEDEEVQKGLGWVFHGVDGFLDCKLFGVIQSYGL